LLNLLSNKFYGARFLSADALKDYWNAYPAKLTDELITNISSDRTTFQAFLNSVNGLPDEAFKQVIDKILTQDISRDEIVNMNLIDLIQYKLVNTTDITFKNYYNEKLDLLRSRSILKVR